METMKKVTRMMLVDKMASYYHDAIMHRQPVGLCYSYRKACRELFNCLLSPSSLHLLPAFVPPSGHVFGEYWWNPWKSVHREIFLQKLRELYKDDETDLTPIVKGYRALHFTDRDVYAKKYLESYEKDLSFDKTDDAVV